AGRDARRCGVACQVGAVAPAVDRGEKRTRTLVRVGVSLWREHDCDFRGRALRPFIRVLDLWGAAGCQGSGQRRAICELCCSHCRPPSGAASRVLAEPGLPKAELPAAARNRTTRTESG